MHSSQHSRARTSFELLCALALAASFVAAFNQTGATALLASAGVAGLFALSRSFELFDRKSAEVPLQPAPRPMERHVLEDAPRIEIFPFEPEPMAEAEPPVQASALAEAEQPRAKPLKAAKPKRRSKKAAAPAEGDEAVVPQPAELAVEEPAFHEPSHIEQLFDPQPFVRQHRPAFGRKSRGPLPAA